MIDYNNINKKFKKYKLQPSNDSMKKICLPKKFKLQPSQKFLADYFTSKNVHPGLLIYHKIGAGKTCTAINIAERLKKKMQVMVVLPAALIGSFKSELRSQCAGDIYLTNSERKKLEKLKPSDEKFKKIIKKSNKQIDKYYTIYSYHKFVALAKEKKINLNNHLLIIDEVQNMISMTGTFYKNLKESVDKAKNLKTVLLSATPMFDKPVEIALTLNLLKPRRELPIGCDFNKKFLKIKHNREGPYYKANRIRSFKRMIRGLVSYYRGAPTNAFPEENFKLVKCKMSVFQYKSYLTVLNNEKKFKRGSFRNVDILKLSNNFFSGPRMISNIAFPNKSFGINGYKSLTKENMKMSEIKNYSQKFYKILKKLKQAEGPVFVYSNFSNYGGLKSFVKFIENHGFKNYKECGEGKKRYAVWTGDESHEIKEEIKYVYNRKENINGERIKIMLGSPSIKEGVSLLRTEQVHILEPYWNISRMLQIIGRAIRFCSHKDVKRYRRHVDVFLYLSTYPDEYTIDEYIYDLAQKKKKLIGSFETALKEMAIDCKLFYHRNVYPDDKPLKCYS
tara:strand:- start:2419 stop:4104 length:1686 start_codon:yes stop_codon:yes gene_type:complete